MFPRPTENAMQANKKSNFRAQVSRCSRGSAELVLLWGAEATGVPEMSEVDPLPEAGTIKDVSLTVGTKGSDGTRRSEAGSSGGFFSIFGSASVSIVAVSLPYKTSMAANFQLNFFS
jgi:hypothetical protein